MRTSYGNLPCQTRVLLSRVPILLVFCFCKNACQFAELSPSEGQAAAFCVVHVADLAFLLCLVARRDAAMELQSNAPHTECKPCQNIVQMPLPHGNCQIQAMLANYQGHACSQKMCSNLWLLSAPGGLKHFAMDLQKKSTFSKPTSLL